MSLQSDGTTGETRYYVLDGMRGIAAIAVMIYHFSLDTGSVFLINADLAVDFFFILSGFVIAHSYGGRLRNGMNPLEYIGKRLIRLYPMFVLGILIGAPVLFLLERAGAANAPARFIVGSVLYNLLFLPDISNFQNGELFPANPPAWSLFFEMIASV